VGQGTCSVTASQAGNDTYAPARDVKKSIRIIKTAQTITFNAPASVALSAGTLALSGSSTSQLSVTFATTTPLICTVDGSTLTLIKVGTCSVTATQAGNDTFAPAREVKKSIRVVTG
jgi:hypothetical protein